MRSLATPGRATVAPWGTLRALAQAATAGLPAPAESGPRFCRCCRGPLRGGHLRCFQCRRHAACAPGLLADTVAPVAYAVKGSQLAAALWRYKSGLPGANIARATLRALLLVFLHDNGGQLWRTAGMTVPTHICVVPSVSGRDGPHPLRALLGGCLSLPWAVLRTQPRADRWVRALDPDRFLAPHPLTGAAVLLLDDTWTTGASAQSAAVALKRAGARSVAAVVLGRHLSPGDLPGGSIGLGGDPGQIPVANGFGAPRPAHQPRAHRAVPGRPH